LEANTSYFCGGWFAVRLPLSATIILPLDGKKFPLSGIFAAQLQC